MNFLEEKNRQNITFNSIMQDYIDIVTDVIIGVIVTIVTKQKTNSTRKKNMIA